MDPNDLPTFGTYVDILTGMLEVWDTCDPYPQPRWASTLIFYISAILTVFYLYVMVIILLSKRLHTRSKRPFYCCTVILAVGDFASLIVCFKDSAVVACVLISPSMNLAWAALGGSGIDFIISVNLVIALVRLEAVIFLTRKQRYFIILYILLALAALWGCIVFYLHFSGSIIRFWRTSSGLRVELVLPWSSLRNDLLFGQLALTFFIYIIVVWQFRKAKSQANFKDVSQELRMLTLALLIFLAELLFVYTSNSIGYHWGLGSRQFNTNLNLVVRPITTGITPFLYIIFSSDVRKACMFSCERKKKENAGSNG